MCIHDIWVVVTKRMKEQCSIAFANLIEKLVRRFPNNEFINATGIVYPQFWLNSEVENMFLSQYCFENEIGVEGLKVLALFNEQKLDMGVSFFKVTMQSNCKHVLEPLVS
jgi:hypothetical protein